MDDNDIIFVHITGIEVVIAWCVYVLVHEFTCWYVCTKAIIKSVVCWFVPLFFFLQRRWNPT